jgi:hypothetical protein
MKLFVACALDLELLAPTAVLALAAIATEDLQFELVAILAIEPNPTSPPHTHADRLISRKNCCCCGAGRNPIHASA